MRVAHFTKRQVYTWSTLRAHIQFPFQAPIVVQYMIPTISIYMLWRRSASQVSISFQMSMIDKKISKVATHRLMKRAARDPKPESSVVAPDKGVLNFSLPTFRRERRDVPAKFDS